MSFYCRVLQKEDIEELLDFESKKLIEIEQNEMEREFIKWNSRWRKESLEHYASLGWSFIARNPEIKSSFSDEGLLVGYFTGQPLLFLDGQTQSLWVEHLSYSALQARDELVEIAYKLARDKHFQRVYFMNNQGVANSVNALKPESWNSQMMYVKTTK